MLYLHRHVCCQFMMSTKQASAINMQESGHKKRSIATKRSQVRNLSLAQGLFSQGHDRHLDLY